MEGVLRHGSAERMEYIRRFVAVLLALVLCMGLLRPPRVSAAAGSAAIAVTASVNPVAAVGVLLLALVGVAVAQEYISSGVAGSAVYDEGQALMDVLAVDPECTAWYRTQQKLVEEGLIPGVTKIQVPAHVMKAARQWAGETYDFSSGPVVTTQNGFYDADRFIAFGNYSNYEGYWQSLSPTATLFSMGDKLVFPSGSYLFVHEYSNGGSAATIYSSSGDVLYRFLGGARDIQYFLNYTGTRFDIGAFNPGTNKVSTNYLFGYSVTLSMLGLSLLSATGTLTPTDVFENPTYEDTTIALPGDIPSTVVDGVTVPVITTLDRDMILEGAGTIDPPIESDPPIVGDQTMVGDIALEDVAKEQESLGAVFISKFPFCIPWDMYHAVKLLSAPAKTPYWEIDFLAPISGRVGGWRGSTKVVIDMGEYEIIGQVSRWVSTILFCATLISGTKKLVWTG